MQSGNFANWRPGTDSKRRNWPKSRRTSRSPKISALFYGSTRRKCEAMKRLDSHYSVRRMCRVLEVSEKQYYQWRIMREYGLNSVTQKKCRPFRHHLESNPDKQDLVQQQFRPEGPNVVGAGDVTYIKIQLSRVYLAVVMYL